MYLLPDTIALVPLTQITPLRNDGNIKPQQIPFSSVTTTRIMSTSPVAIVTGGSSGIGLALVKHLRSLRWRVAIADLVKPDETITDTIFIQTDVTSWDAQFSMFKQVHAWGGRLDFCALNAGLDDRDDIFGSLSYDEKLVPGRPNTKAISVNFIGTYVQMSPAAWFRPRSK